MLSHVQLSVTPWTVAHQAPLSMGFSRQEYWVGCHAPLQEIFPTQGSNPCLLPCGWILYHWAAGEAHLDIQIDWFWGTGWQSCRGCLGSSQEEEQAGPLGHKLKLLYTGSVTEAKLTLLVAWQANEPSGRGAEARNMTAFRKPADQGDGRLTTSQNNRLVGIWMPSSFMDQRWGKKVKKRPFISRASPRMASLRQGPCWFLPSCRLQVDRVLNRGASVYQAGRGAGSSEYNHA